MTHLKLEERPDWSTQTFLIALAVPRHTLRILKKSPSCEMRKILRESYFALIVCVIAGTLAGAILSSMTDTLLSLPGLLIIIPGAIAMRGNIFASLGARLGTYLHSGQIDDERMSSPLMKENILASLSQTMLLSSALGILAFYFIPSETGGIVLLSTLLLVSVLAGLLAGFSLIFITTLTAVWGFRRGWDPDNITAPIITTAGDLLTLPCIIAAAHFVMNRGEDFIITMAIATIIISILFTAFFASGNKRMSTILKQSLPVLAVCAVIATIAGHFLEARLESLVVFSGLLILFPPFNDTSGNLGAILSARLSSAAHMGTTKIKSLPDRVAMQNMAAIFLLLMLVFPGIGVIAHITAISLGFASPGLVTMVLISFFGGLIMGGMIMALSYYFTYFSYRMSVDPDNVVIPLLTSSADALGILVLVSLLALFGAI